MAMKRTVNYCLGQNLHGVQIKTESLVVTHMINKDCRIPWEYIENFKYIQQTMESIQSEMIHVYREANQLADCIVNQAFVHIGIIHYNIFAELPSEARKILNIDKAQIQSLRIHTRPIKP